MLRLCGSQISEIRRSRDQLASRMAIHPTITLSSVRHSFLGVGTPGHEAIVYRPLADLSRVELGCHGLLLVASISAPYPSSSQILTIERQPGLPGVDYGAARSLAPGPPYCITTAVYFPVHR